MTSSDHPPIRKFYFLRHGETDWNHRLKLLQGHTDIPLNEIGHQQASEMAGYLKNFGFQRAISSDLVRAQETARYLDLPIHIDENLREINLGIAEGKSWDFLEKNYSPGFRQEWSSNTPSSLDLRFEAGESRREVTTRVLRSISSHLKSFPDQSLVFVSHGFVIRSLIYHSTSIEIPFFVPNCALVPFGWNGEQLIYLGPPKPDELLQPLIKTNNPYS